MSGLLLLLLAFLFLGCSCLAIFPAPNTFLWILAIGATEYGHWFVFVPMLLMFVGRRTAQARGISVLSLLACVLFLSPLLRAISVRDGVCRETCRIFPVADAGVVGKQGPWLRMYDLWFGKNERPVVPENIPFAEHEGVPLSLRFYRAIAQGTAPCVVVLHTGGWTGGSTDEFQEFNSHFARRGYAVAVVEYRLAPHWKWPAQRDDVFDAMQRLRERAGELGVDPTRFVLLGRSAGGQIAEAVAYGNGAPQIRGVIAFYAPADMHFAFEYARADDLLNSLKLLRDYLGGDPAERPENYNTASGIGLVHSASPPTLLLHGLRDELVWSRQSERLAAKLTEVGVPSHLLAFEWATHAFDFNPHGPGGQLSTRAIERFLDSVTAPSGRGAVVSIQP